MAQRINSSVLSFQCKSSESSGIIIVDYQYLSLPRRSSKPSTPLTVNSTAPSSRTTWSRPNCLITFSGKSGNCPTSTSTDSWTLTNSRWPPICWSWSSKARKSPTHCPTIWCHRRRESSPPMVETSIAISVCACVCVCGHCQFVSVSRRSFSCVSFIYPCQWWFWWATFRRKCEIYRWNVFYCAPLSGVIRWFSFRMLCQLWLSCYCNRYYIHTSANIDVLRCFPLLSVSHSVASHWLARTACFDLAFFVLCVCDAIGLDSDAAIVLFWLVGFDCCAVIAGFSTSVVNKFASHPLSRIICIHGTSKQIRDRKVIDQRFDYVKFLTRDK